MESNCLCGARVCFCFDKIVVKWKKGGESRKGRCRLGCPSLFRADTVQTGQGTSSHTRHINHRISRQTESEEQRRKRRRREDGSPARYTFSFLCSVCLSSFTSQLQMARPLEARLSLAAGAALMCAAAILAQAGRRSAERSVIASLPQDGPVCTL